MLSDVASTRIGMLLLLSGSLVTLPCATQPCQGQDASAPQLNLVLDGTLAALGIGTFVTGTIISAAVTPPERQDIAGLADAEIPTFDRMLMFSYSEQLNWLSPGFQFTSALLPIAMAGYAWGQTGFEGTKTLVGTAILYFESLSIALGMKDIVKSLTRRFRPYAYQPGLSDDLVLDADTVKSFPSGHTTAAFTGAAFTISMLLLYQQDSVLKLPLSVAALAVATTTAVLRVVSGQHFATDVLAGAAIGSAAGIIVPLLHRSRLAVSRPAARWAGQQSP